MAEIPQRAQVVVVGGGAIGTATAYHLNKIGVTDVVLLERKELTAGTTWHAAGLITSAGMPTESFLWMSRYTTELLPKLTEETGQETGFRTIGHLHLGCSPQRVETITREAIFAKAHGVPVEMVGPEEVRRHWPTIKADDIIAAAWVPDEGRANPADITQAFAKGARSGGTKIIQGVAVTGFMKANGRVTGVITEQGTIETETVVIAAGIWGRQLGELAGVSLPLQAAEHYYLLTDEVEWADTNAPVVEDPDRYGYYREEGGGMLVGLFEPEGAPWMLDEIPRDLGFAVLPPDWDRTGGFLANALERFPGLDQVGIRQFFCGPESFTADNGPLLGEVPELRGFFSACGLNSLGILLAGGVGSLMAQWIVDGEPPMDVTGMSVDRMLPFMGNRSFRKERTVELLGDLLVDTASICGEVVTPGTPEALDLLPDQLWALIVFVDALDRCPWAAFSGLLGWRVGTYLGLAAAFVRSAYTYALCEAQIVSKTDLSEEEKVFVSMLSCRDPRPLLSKTEEALIPMLTAMLDRRLPAASGSGANGPLGRAAAVYCASPVYKAVADFVRSQADLLRESAATETE